MLRHGFLWAFWIIGYFAYAQSLEPVQSASESFSTKTVSTPVNDTHLVEADSSINHDVEDSNVAFRHPLNDDLSIDSIWLCGHAYYNTWTSEKINPYDLDGVKYTDTFSIQIVDPHQVSRWAMPISNTRITSAFGFRRYRWHYGTDLKLYYGDTVVAAFDGIVRIVDYERYGYGRYIVLRHLNGLETLYGHLSKTKVKIGDEVKAGELIGLGGSTGRSTGTHLHFEVRYQGNAINPNEIYDFTANCLREERFSVTPASFSYLVEARKKRYHRIRRGDTLGHIALRYGTTVSRLCRLNGISRNTILRVGRRLRIS